MVQRLCCFLVVFLLMFNGEIFGQGSSYAKIPFSNNISITKSPDSFKPRFELNQFLKYNDCSEGNKHILLSVPTSSFYINNLGFICKKEFQLDKITPVAFRFRLGSLEYVNWMEQKPNAIKPR